MKNAIVTFTWLVLSWVTVQADGATPKERATTDRLKKDDVVILFGNIGYTDVDTQPALFGLLSDGSFAIEDVSDNLMVHVNSMRKNGFSKLSKFPVAVHLDELEAVIAKRLGKVKAPYDGTDKLPQYFSRVLGVLLIGSYEDHKSFSYPYSLNDGTSRLAYHDYFVTSVSAMLVDLQTDEILQSTTAFGVKRLDASDAPITDSTVSQGQFLEAYTQASDRALSRLSKLVAKKGIRALSPDSDRHMVTGAWVNGKAARELFNWKFPGPPRDMCDVPNGCGRDDLNCLRLTGLLVHGFTDALSEAGYNTLPPLGWADWRADNAMHFSRRFMISENKKSLIDRLIDISVDPKNAGTKYVPALDSLTHSSSDLVKTLETIDNYVVTMSLNLAATGTGEGSCSAKGVQTIDKPNFAGAMGSKRPLLAQLHDVNGKRFFYSLAIMQALPTLLAK